MVLTIIGVIIMIHLVLVVHELGHLVVGLWQGFRFELFVVGLLGIKREGEKIKVYLNKHLGYYGGVVATFPIDDSEDNPKKFARVLLAGPIASILFAVFCFVVFYFVEKPLGLVFMGGGVTSLGIFLATTIPSKTGIFFSDRKRYQRLVTPGKDQEVEFAMLRIMGQFSKDNSYKNIEREDIEVLISDKTPFVKYYGLFNMVCWQLEHTGKVEEGVEEEYASASKKMSKNLVWGLDKEIEKYRAKFGMDLNNV